MLTDAGGWAAGRSWPGWWTDGCGWAWGSAGCSTGWWNSRSPALRCGCCSGTCGRFGARFETRRDRDEDRDYVGEWRHSQVLERQSGEGDGLDLHDVVVAEVECFQGDEGPELLRQDPGDPVVCSENTDTVAPINDKNTACLTRGTHRFHVSLSTNTRVPQLAFGIRRCLSRSNSPPSIKCYRADLAHLFQELQQFCPLWSMFQPLKTSPRNLWVYGCVILFIR